MAYKSRFTDKPTKRVSAGQLAQKTKDSYSKSFDKKQREVRKDKQKQELNQFKGELMASDRVLKDSSGNFVYNKNTGEPVYLGSKPVFDTDSSSPTFGQYVSTSVADKSQQLANKYGPTFKEILGDIGGGLGSIFQGFAEKGPPILQIIKGLSDKFKGGVESAWDKVRGEPTSVQGTAFPQPGSDTKDYFSSVDTGIAQVDPDNMLVQIAKANEGRFDDKPTFQDQLANATVENLNVPKIGDVAQTIGDYYNAYQEGVNVNTPIGTVNLNPAREGIFLQNKLNNLPISYSGSYTPGLNQATAGIQMALPNDYKLTGGTNFNEGDLSLSKSYNSYLRGVNDITPYVSTNLDESRAGVSVGFDPLAALGIPSSLAVPINVGVSTDQSGNITPNFNLRVPFQYGNEGLGFMFK